MKGGMKKNKKKILGNFEFEPCYRIKHVEAKQKRRHLRIEVQQQMKAGLCHLLLRQQICV
jgi:hypothetical protein